MRRFLGIIMMGALALGVAHAHAETEYANMQNKEFIKLAGTFHSAEEVLEYQAEFDKRLKAMKGKARADFKAQVNKTYKANLAKMSAKDFAALRKEVAEALEENRKEHSHKELMEMGLDVQVCKTTKRELLCPHKHTKKHAAKHSGEGEHGHHGAKHENGEKHEGKHEEGAKKGGHKAPASKGEHEETKQENTHE
ncbi:DUF1104 domain-containing protein [Helicobacter salomonis]|uniref:DUF1104 domain-containing protein n=1 Tax=Helicobacter salomonis TaxID=56878 RepID=UPI000CF0AE32|nr:DUF1104 domain-containing protein [Helicobacter salomonis]